MRSTRTIWTESWDFLPMIACWRCRRAVNRMARALKVSTMSGKDWLHVLKDYPTSITEMQSILWTWNLKPHFEMVPHRHRPGWHEGGGSGLRLLYIPRGRSDSKRLVLENC